MYFRLIIIIILTIYHFARVNSQSEWAPFGAHWYYTYSSIFNDDIYFAEMYPEKDTLINDLSARILKTVYYITSELVPFYRDDIIIRQEGNKIYRWINNDFKILYDFDLVVGDTLEIYVENEFDQNDSIAFLVLEEIDSIEIDGNSIRRQRFYPPEMGAAGYAVQFASSYVLEYAGSGSYFIPISQLECDGYCIDQLRCYSTDWININVYNIPCDTVVIVSNTEDYQLNKGKVKLYPNPVQSLNPLKIEFEGDFGNTAINLELLDIHGVVRYRSDCFLIENQLTINPILSPGIYLVRILFNDDSIVVNRVIVMN